MNLHDIYVAQNLGTAPDLHTKLIAEYLGNVPEPQALLSSDSEPITTTDGEQIKTRR